MTLDALIEKAARALMAHELPDWDHATEFRRQWCRANARAALLAVLPDIGEHLAGVVEGFESPGLLGLAFADDVLRAEVRRLTGGGDE